MKYAIAVYKKTPWGNDMFVLELTEDEYRELERKHESMTIPERRELIDEWEENFD